MTEVPHEAAAVIVTAVAIGTVAEIATEVAVVTAAARGATEAVTGVGRQARATEAAVGAGATGRGPDRTPHVEAEAIPTTTKSSLSSRTHQRTFPYSI